MSLESRLKMTLSRTGKPSNHCGHSHSPESRQKMSESHRGMVSGMKGKKHTLDTLKQLSDLKIGQPLNERHRVAAMYAVRKAMRRPEVRKKHLKALTRSRWLGQMMDDGQIELLQKWNCLGFYFQPNYQLQVADCLFYLDGYDPIHNVVLEYDSKYHKKRIQKEKDLIRQNIIINTLHPKKFWRYDATTKQTRNVMEDV